MASMSVAVVYSYQQV